MTDDGVADDARVLDVETAQGLARAHLHRPGTAARGLLVLGHGAGGGVAAPDLRAATRVALDLGLAVALVEQPYRVAGKRVGPRAPALDEAWTEVVERVRAEAGGILVVGGRSAGARVACRTARATGAAGVLCLAFPVRPPGKPDAPDRLPELDGTGVPTLVVQGENDPFGRPPSAPGRDVVAVAGDHGLKKDLPAVAAAVRTWLAGIA